MNIEAIQKINTEMQKKPNDPYTEIIGHYVIDRCVDDITAAKVLKTDKTLEGAMKAVLAVAQKAKNGNVAILTPAQVFGEVDRYFDLATDLKAQQKALATAGAGPAPQEVQEAQKTAAKKLGLDLAAFM